MSIQFSAPIAPHSTDLYQSFGAVESVDGFEDWNDDALARFRTDGFVVVRHAIPAAMVEAVLRELREMAAAADPDCAHVQYEYTLRAQVESILGGSVDEADAGAVAAAVTRLPAEARSANLRKFMGFTKTHPVLKDVSNHGPLRDAVEQIAGEPTRMWQSMALLKPPGGSEKPWHQDHAFFNLPIDAQICGVWIALGEVTEDNGAMFMLRGGHRIGPIPHFQRRDWQICDTELQGKKPVAVTMQAGDLIIFDGKTPHGTPTNRTDSHRWAVQYHYIGRSIEEVDKEYRMAIFGEEGKNVSC